MNAFSMLFGAFLIWWVFIKHDPNKFHFGLGNFERDKKNDKDENGNQ